MLEHIFLSEVLQYAYRRQQPVGVLRTEVDRAGYDLVLEFGEVTRYIQLKSSSARNRRPTPPDVNSKLATKPGGCIVWIWLENENEDDKNHVKLKYKFLEAGPSKRPNLGHTKGKRDGTLRPSAKCFTTMNITELIEKLLNLAQTSSHP